MPADEEVSEPATGDKGFGIYGNVVAHEKKVRASPGSHILDAVDRRYRGLVWLWCALQVVQNNWMRRCRVMFEDSFRGLQRPQLRCWSDVQGSCATKGRRKPWDKRHLNIAPCSENGHAPRVAESVLTRTET